MNIFMNDESNINKQIKERSLINQCSQIFKKSRT
jgi:hypothetical protein